MAVYPDRIVLKNSEESGADITAAIAPGGSDEILRGELVLGLSAGSARLFTVDNQGNVVQFGGSDAAFLGGLEDVDLGGLVDGQVIRWDASESLWKPANYNVTDLDGISTYSLGAGTPFPGTGQTLIDTSAIADGYRIGTSGHISQEAGSSDIFMGVRYSSSATRGVKVGRSPGTSISLYSASGITNFTGAQDATGDAEIRLYLKGETRYSGFRSSSNLSSNIVWTLPDEIGESGRVLTSNGSGGWYWSVGPAPDLSSSSLGSIGDVDLTGLEDGDYIRWDEDSSSWLAVAGFTGDLDGLSDVRVTSDIVYVDHTGFVVNDESDSAAFNNSVSLLNSTYAASISFSTSQQTRLTLGSSRYSDYNGVITEAGKPFTVGNTQKGILRLGKASSTTINTVNVSKAVTLSTDTATQDYELVLPPATGGSGQVLGTDGTGKLGWYDTYPPVGNGLIEYTIDVNASPPIIYGEGVADGYPQPDLLVLVPGLSYRFTSLDDTVGISVRSSQGAYIDGGMSGIGVVGAPLAWTVPPNAPSEGLTIGRSDTSSNSSRTPLAIYAETVPLSRNSIGDVYDVDVTTVPPNFNQALVWDGSNWTPAPVYSELGSIYLQGASWNTRVPTEPEADADGFFTSAVSFLGQLGTYEHKLVLNEFTSGNVSAASVFDSIIAEGDDVWVNITYFYSNGTTAATGLSVSTSLERTGSSTYTLTFNAAYASPTSTSIAVTLLQRRLLEIPVDSVNGQTGEVVLDVADINDVFSESLTDLEVGFPYIKKTSGLTGGVELRFVNLSDGSSEYRLTFNNVDAAGVNRRELAAKQNNAYIRKAEEDTWIPLQVSPQVDSTGVYSYFDISSEATDLFLQSGLNQAFFVKFEINPQEGYTLSADSILQYDFKDGLWKPASPQISAGVSSVNGETGDVILALGDLADVESTTPTDGQGLVWQGSSWAPGSLGDSEIRWTISNSDSSDYLFSGPGFTGPTADPTLYVMRGQTYIFEKLVTPHPFQLQALPGIGQSAYEEGVTGTQPLAAGTIEWVVPMDAPDVLYYQCTAHSPMFGQIIVTGGGVDVELALDDLTDVSYSNGSLEINALDQVAFSSADVPSGETWKVYANPQYGMAMGAYSTSNTEGSFVYAHSTKGIELRPEGSEIIRLSGRYDQTINQPELRWESGNATGDSPTGKYIGLKMPAGVTVNQTYILPALDGSAGQVLSTDGSGVMSWADSASEEVSPLTVQAKNGAAGAPLGITSNVSTLSFNTGNGFSVTDLGSGEAFIELGSSFAPWYVDGQATLAPAGEEPIKFIAGSGISITTNPNTLVKEIKFEATGGGSGGSGSGAAADLVSETATTATGLATFEEIGLSGILVEFECDVDAWITLYPTAALRAADTGRVFGEDPQPGSGILSEAYVLAGTSVLATPGTVYFNNDTPATSAVYALVRGTDGTLIDSATVDVKAYPSVTGVPSAVGGGGGGSTGTRLNETRSAVDGEASFVGLGHSGAIVSVAATAPAWIVIYGSEADRTADSSRAFNTDPALGSGVFAEFYVEAGQTALATPGTTYFNNDTAMTEAMYVAVRDSGGNDLSCDVTIVAYGNQVITAISGGTFGSGL
jgi:hypothetical protein